jgi:ubiquinone/menaquinone biosynthesis C-methylase UbiE
LEGAIESMSGLEASRQFWDEKARENPYWYVSSAGPYEGRNLAEFWASGPKIWNDLKSASGYEPKRTDAVVEIGCGVGRLTRAIAPEVDKVFAFDLSAEMLAIARGSVEAPNASFHRAETPALAEIADGSIDAFIAYCVFQHLPDLEVLRAYLQTAARVLKPGGVVMFTMTPRTWRDSIAFALRMRRWLIERRSAQGPRGLYRSAWYGIRPTIQEIRELSPIKTKNVLLHGDKWLFCGTR